MTRLPIYLVVTGALLWLPAAAQGQGSPVLTNNPTLQASLDRIARGSALWRQAIDALRATGRRAIVVTPDQVRVADASRAGATDRFDHTVVAEIAPLVQDDQRIDVVLVVVNVALIDEQHRERRLLPIEFEMDLDRILVHEVYGHAVPYLLAGDLSGRCADPQAGQRATEACSIRRENAVRAELGLGRRVDYGLNGLNLTRRH
jgi:hypothetical protein